ncbi:hypothetical protein D3227_34785 [Mesorhizobium waimense]|uniref:Uncharacterized protein n=1 Tax=Mesorhizobium waimense TaxID=1300307 RepID=A0A3A5K6F6_9HYPH|nr:hypothetical protein [Mesorhizobium waimense]RJT28149.1 hypothetical protein D3227_34785 [Mesorhizobium waimense]
MAGLETPEDIFDRKPTPEELTQKFNAALKELMLTPGDLATFMDKNRDYREGSATIRGIQRMVSGETRVSGEMMVIVNMLLRQHRRLKARYPDLKWERNPHGAYWAQVEDWYVYISPQTRGRWILVCSHGSSPKDYSPPFGRWLDSLEEAKAKALVCVEEGMNNLAEFDYEAT